MEDTTAIVTTDHCAPVTKAAKQQAPGDEEDEEAGGWDIGTESWNTQSAASAAMKLPVLTQPGLGVTTTTVTTITQTGGDWSSSLFNVCGDRTTCLLGAFVPCCLDLSLAHQYGECLCLPLLPGSTFAMRVGIRERYKIQGSVCEDWTTVNCCYPLAICQMIREMKRRMKSQTYKENHGGAPEETRQAV
ncbi:cornifelin homolog A isoform X1 [Salmo trutta]|uniref:PLAC8 like 1 n=1 Tax=Salmo trutta TaxID=8032 RepID=A0A673WR69_SALTR|nr:cornifelin homolog A-like isoform X1 [Salmo trutta]